ncbi:MAG: hypothetical protein ACRD2N_03110 [Vicinamibacterales bacterium]
MVRRLLVIVLLVSAAVPLVAQAPDGWSVRIDRSTNAQDPDDTPNLKFVTMGKGFHVTSGPAGTFWNPKNTATGDFTARATFTLMKPSGHVNYYGLIFGGSDLGAATQTYGYFVVAQNGTFLIRHRSGEQVTDVQARTPNAAVVQPGADGQSKNALEVRVAGNTVSYVVNGTVVHTTPKSGMTAKTDGLVGIRVNHLLDVHIEGFDVQKK